MRVSTDPRWRALASSAAAQLGTSSPDIVRAILAQWQCEQGNVWPPTRNNPGNVARGWAAAISIPYTVTYPNPQPGNPIVTYASPEAGAASYAAGLRTFSRYAGVRAAVAKGDGAAFLKAVTSAGYGTGYACALSVYQSNGGSSTPAPLPSPGAPDVGTGTPAILEGLAPDLGRTISDAAGRTVVLVFILAGVLLGAWLLFREPAVKIAGAVAAARMGG